MFFNPFKHKEAEEIRAAQLCEAQRTLAEIEAAVEFNTAMRDMLVSRIARLSKHKDQ